MTVKETPQGRTFNGAGQLEDPDGHSTSVSYMLVEHEEIVDAGSSAHPAGRLPGTKKLQGTIRAGRLPCARECILHLEDGFRVKVILKASDGHVAQVDSVGRRF